MPRNANNTAVASSSSKLKEAASREISALIGLSFPPYTFYGGNKVVFKDESDFDEWAFGVSEGKTMDGESGPHRKREIKEAALNNYKKMIMASWTEEMISEYGTKVAKVLKSSTELSDKARQKLKNQQEAEEHEHMMREVTMDSYLSAFMEANRMAWQVRGYGGDENEVKVHRDDMADYLVQYRELLSMHKNKAKDPTRVNQYASKIHGMEQLYNQLVAQDPLVELVESWEQLADGPKHELPPGEVQKKLLEGIEVKFPFQTDKPTLEQKASHTMLNSSRVAAGGLMLMQEVRRAIQLRDAPTANPLARPKICIMDMGSGAFGVERLLVLMSHREVGGLFFHAALPFVDTADEDRHKRFRTNKMFNTFNYLPESRVPRPGVLNYCYHTAADCDCFRRYDKVQVLSVHSSYYYTIDDWENLTANGHVDCLEHVASIGRTIPMAKPEFEWVKKTRDTFTGKLKDAYEEWAVGHAKVEMRPLQTGCTPYEHEDNSVSLKAGGFHVGALTKWAERMGKASFSTFKNYVKAAAIGAAAGVVLPGAVSVMAPLAAASAVAATAMAVKVENERKYQEQPPVGTKYTIHKHITKTWIDAETKEEIAHTVRVTKSAPMALLRQKVESETVEPQSVARAVSSFLLGGVATKVRNGVCATLIRDGLPTVVTKYTVDHAERMYRFLVPEVVQPPPPWSATSLLAVVCLPYALGLSRWCSSTLYATLLYRARGYRAGAIWLLQHGVETHMCLTALFFPLTLAALLSLATVMWVLWC